MQLAVGPISVTLTPIRYQFPDMHPTGPDSDWNANWLVIRGEVRDRLVSWSFADPCLTTREARELETWLRALADSNGDAASAAETLWFTEPNLTVRTLGHANGTVTIEIAFSQESAPPGSDETVRFGEGHRVVLVMTRAAIRGAADEWEREIARFPERR